VKNRAIRFLSTDTGKIVSLATVILLLALGGIELSRVLSAGMLRADALSTSSAWADTLVDGVDDIPAIIAGAPPSEQTEHLLKEASQVGEIYRYRIWSTTGRLVFTSERKSSSQPPLTIAERFGQGAAKSILSGAPFIESGAGSPPDNPVYYADTCIPIKRNGAVIGILEVYFDQTGDKALYEWSFLITEIIIAIVVLLAGGIPGFMVYRKMLGPPRRAG